MQTGASPELPSGQRRSCPGKRVSLRFGWRQVEHQLSPGHLDSEENLENKEKKWESLTSLQPSKQRMRFADIFLVLPYDFCGRDMVSRVHTSAMKQSINTALKNCLHSRTEASVSNSGKKLEQQNLTLQIIVLNKCLIKTALSAFKFC